MSNYRLVDHGYPFKKIMHGKKWVGRVYQHADGTWHGAISKVDLSKASSPVKAFEQAVARHLGYNDVDELKARNRSVRAANRQRSARGRQLAREYMGAKTFEERMDVLDKIFGKQ